MRKILLLMLFITGPTIAEECVIRQSTATTIQVGPFEDNTGALMNALTISAGDVFISKAGAVFAAKSDAGACTFDSRGMYRCPFAAALDTATRGNFVIRIDETAAGALPYAKDCVVLSVDAFDAHYGPNNMYAAVTGVDADLAAVATDVTSILTDTGTTLDTKLNTLQTDLTSVKTTVQTTGVPLAANSITANAYAVGALDTDAFTAAAITAMNAGLATAAGLTTAVANVSVDEVQNTALADFFNTNSGTTYAASVAGSPVREIVTNVSGGGGGGDPWATTLPGAYSSTQAGGILATVQDTVTNSGVEVSETGAATIWSHVVEPNGEVTAACAMAIQSALIYGEYVQSTSAGVGQVTARDQDGTSVRLTATITSNGRNNITITCP